MSQRTAVSKTIATRCKRVQKAAKGVMLARAEGDDGGTIAIPAGP